MNFDLANSSGVTVFAHIQGLPGQPDSMKVTGIPDTPAPVPEPATLLLLGTGIAGVMAKIRRRNKAGKSEDA